MKFCSACNYSSYTHRSRTPSQFVSGWNKNLILPFYWVLIDFLLCDKNEISAFHSSRICYLVYLFSIKSKSWCCDWLSFVGDEVEEKGCFCRAQHVFLSSSFHFCNVSKTWNRARITECNNNSEMIDSIIIDIFQN